MKKWFVPAFLALLVLAAALRLPELGLRPMHNDEGVNAMKFRALWVDNKYAYDPREFHGPTLPYFTWLIAELSGTRQFNDFTETTYRLVPVCFGIGLILLLLCLTRDLGRAEVLAATALTAISPAMVFYSRYYIHEMLLVFFSMMTGIALWRHRTSERFFWCGLAGAGVGLMWATKETFVFVVGAMAIAVIVNFFLLQGTPGTKRWSVKYIAAAFCIALAVAALFFSSFFTNAAGLTDAVKTYLPWLHRAEGSSPHIHPWYFYFQRLLFYSADRGPFWSEGLIFGLALIGFVAGVVGRGLGTANVVLVRLIGIYTLCLTLTYTFLPYKTPWCLLGFWDGMILLAGIGAAVLVRFCGKGDGSAGASPYHGDSVGSSRAGVTVAQCLVICVLLVLGGQLGWQAWRGNFALDRKGIPYCDDAKNPYVYSQTAPDALRLVETVDGLARASERGYNSIVEVMSPESYWPLPWYLRKFGTNVGFWDALPPNPPPAPIRIVSADLHAGFDEQPDHKYLMTGYYELRPGVFFELYVNPALWAQYVKTLPPEKD